MASQFARVLFVIGVVLLVVRMLRWRPAVAWPARPACKMTRCLWRCTFSP
jgi:hypothetical protein